MDISDLGLADSQSESIAKKKGVNAIKRTDLVPLKLLEISVRLIKTTNLVHLFHIIIHFNYCLLTNDSYVTYHTKSK